VNGNKPSTVYKSAFTRQVARFPRTAYYPLPGRGCLTAVAFVIDELLVGRQAASDPQVTTRLRTLGAYDTGATVFAGLTPPPSQDIHIWRLRKTPGDKPYPDVAAVVWSVRRVLVARHIHPAQVAPNHVLIPSPNWHSCPAGPPEQASSPGSLPAAATPAVSVVVIDSGYIDGGVIKPRIQHPIDHGQWFTGTPDPSDPAKVGKPFSWTAAAPEVLDADGDGALDSLVGHADFVAGVIAQACPRARINLADHNGAFVENDVADTPIPTEASVARSLWKHRSASVINVGFAFATLPAAELVANATDISGPPSWTFELVLQGIDRKKTVVVSPAGNQRCPVPQYPAAFHLDPAHPNVIGVGSISPTGKRSQFSNFGSWVACCTEGENVLSTFIPRWAGPTADAEPAGSPDAGKHPSKHFSSGWAHWSGTSFAAPKVAAAIANGIGPGGSPLDAWNVLRSSHPATNLGMGHVISGLPPA
jgi:hypothetical protein